MYVYIYIYRWKGNEKEKENENSSGGWPRGERVIAAITGIKRRKEKDATILGIRTREREGGREGRVGGACSSADAAYGLYSNER